MNLQCLKLIRFTFRILVFSLLVIFSQGILNANAGIPQPPQPPPVFNPCILIPDDIIEDIELTQLQIACPPFELTTVVGEGCASVSGPGITCGLDCDQIFQDVTPILITAVPEEGFEFVRWEESPDCEGGSPTLEVLVDHTFTCTAVCQQTGSGQPEVIPIDIGGELIAQGDGNEDFEIMIDPNGGTGTAKVNATVSQEAGPQFENVVVVINVPSGVIINNASVGEDEEACEIINETQVECTIPELTEATTINLNLFIPDLGGQILLAQILLTTDTFPGLTLEQFLNIVAGSAVSGGTGSGGCTLADAGSSKNALLLFALLPAVVFFRKLIRKMK
ncbi:MAG: hypothetical protein ACR2NW_10045 [Thermodesulfobacteriota bacterium]